MDRISKKVFVLAALCFIMLAVCTTMAWLNFMDEMTNVLHVNDSSFHITLIDVFTPSADIHKEDAVQKKVTVENNGSIVAFVRVLILPVVFSKDNIVLKAQLGQEVLINDLNTTQWKDGGDGYYYYLYKLMPGEKAADLFNSVSLAHDLPDDYIGASFSIQVKTESIIANNDSYRDAWWNGSLSGSAYLEQIDNALKVQIR